MVRFPNAKINLGLHVVRKRPDGYHDLETIFYPIGLKDALEILPLQGQAPALPPISVSGIEVQGNATDNICVKAYHLLKNDFPDLPAVQIFLHKAIPTGAGLGGGSSDGAAMLSMLNEMFRLGLDATYISRYALTLGSDCPFFVYNKPCFAQGRGEILAPVNLSLAGFTMWLINPGIHVSTAEAFRGVRPAEPALSLEEAILEPVECWPALLQNDFEASVFPAYPEIQRIKEALYECGASYASMSGSGSSVYGIFRGVPTVTPVFPREYRQFQIALT